MRVGVDSPNYRVYGGAWERTDRYTITIDPQTVEALVIN